MARRTKSKSSKKLKKPSKVSKRITLKRGFTNY